MGKRRIAARASCLCQLLEISNELMSHSRFSRNLPFARQFIFNKVQTQMEHLWEGLKKDMERQVKWYGYEIRIIPSTFSSKPGSWDRLQTFATKFNNSFLECPGRAMGFWFLQWVKKNKA